MIGLLPGNSKVHGNPIVLAILTVPSFSSVSCPRIHPCSRGDGSVVRFQKATSGQPGSDECSAIHSSSVVGGGGGGGCGGGGGPGRGVGCSRFGTVVARLARLQALRMLVNLLRMLFKYRPSLGPDFG